MNYPFNNFFIVTVQGSSNLAHDDLVEFSSNPDQTDLNYNFLITLKTLISFLKVSLIRVGANSAGQWPS